MMLETFDRSQYPPITTLGDALRATPMCWSDLPADYQRVLEYDLLPYTVADPAKVGWVRKWWLKATQDDIDAINAALPAHVRVSGRELVAGGYALSCDLLSDSKPGQTYAAAREIIKGLVLVYEPEFVPMPEVTFGATGAEG